MGPPDDLLEGAPRFDPFELIGWRIISASIVMAGVITVRRRWTVLTAALRRPRTALRLAVAAVLLTANWTAYVWAVANDRVLETALGYFMAPLATMILGVTVLGERASRLQKAALVLAAAAVVVLTVSYGRPPWIALVIAVSWSLYGLLKRQVPLTPIESLAGETFILLVPAVVLVAVLAGRADSVPSTRHGRRLGARRPHRRRDGRARCCSSPSPPSGCRSRCSAPCSTSCRRSTSLLGWLVYDESMPADRLVGFALVWIALIAVTVDQVGTSSRRAERESARALSPTAGR